MRISPTTIIIGSFIVISASFTRQLVDILKHYLGEKGIILLVGALFISFVLVFLIFVIKNYQPAALKLASFLIIFIIGLTLMWKIKIMIEKVHILEYGLLGWFAARDLIRNKKKIKGIILTTLLVVCFGLSDEVFQKILPYRIGETRDVVLNGLGGLWGIFLYIIVRK